MASDKGNMNAAATESDGDADKSNDRDKECKVILMALTKATLFLEHCPTVWGPPDINRAIPAFLSSVATFGMGGPATFAVTNKEDSKIGDTVVTVPSTSVTTISAITDTAVKNVNVASAASDGPDTVVSSAAGPPVDIISALSIAFGNTVMDDALTTGTDKSETNNVDFASIAALANAVVRCSVDDVSTTCDTTTNTVVSDSSVCSNSGASVSGVDGSTIFCDDAVSRDSVISAAMPATATAGTVTSFTTTATDVEKEDASSSVSAVTSVTFTTVITVAATATTSTAATVTSAPFIATTAAAAAGSKFTDATIRISADVDNFSPIEKMIATDSLDTILRTVVYYFAVQGRYGTFAADTLGVMNSSFGGRESRFFKHAKLDQYAANVLLIQRAWISICAGDPFVYRYHRLRSMMLGLVSSNAKKESSSASASTSKEIQELPTYSYVNPLDVPLLPEKERLNWIDRKNSLIHAMKCDNPLGNKSEECTKPTCSRFKFVLGHIKKCPNDRNCAIDGCIETKRTVKHWKICNKTCCWFCLVGKLLFMLDDESFISEVTAGGMPESMQEFCKRVGLEWASKMGSANAASSQSAATGSNAAFLKPSTRQEFEMLHLKVIQQRTYLASHALLCRNEDGSDWAAEKMCDVPYCRYIVNVMKHTACCVEGIFCPVQYCFAIKLTRRHWKICPREECHICAPVCLLIRLRKAYNEIIPHPLEHIMLEQLFGNSIQARAVLTSCRDDDSFKFGFSESNEGDGAGGVQDGSNLPRFFTATETKSPPKRASPKNSSKGGAKK